MKVTYDQIHNVAYIRLHEKEGPVDTVRVGDALNIDMAPDGTVYGIELLNASEQLRAEPDGHLVSVLKTSCSQTEGMLAVHEESPPYGSGNRDV